MLKDLIHKLVVMTKKIDIIDAKTDLLYLGMVSSQLQATLDKNSMAIMAIYDELKQPQWKDVKVDDPRKVAKYKEVAAARAQNELMSVTLESFNLALKKLIIGLAPIMEERHPTLKGEMTNVARVQKQEQKPEAKKNEPRESPANPVPPVRPANEAEKRG